MSSNENFQKASEDVKNLKTKPDNSDLLALYAFYKQATEGDVTGSRPGMIDIRGRKKYDAWAKIKGTAADEAEKQYIDLVESLKSKYGF